MLGTKGCGVSPFLGSIGASAHRRICLSLFYLAITELSLHAGQTAGQVRTSACLLFRQCPPFPACGVYRICHSDEIVVCSECSEYPENGSAPRTVCDFERGQCVGNNNRTRGLSGAVCTSETRDVCGRSHSCQVDTTMQDLTYRCCRSSCPPGAWGTPEFSWTNECGVEIRCPTSDPHAHSDDRSQRGQGPQRQGQQGRIKQKLPRKGRAGSAGGGISNTF